MFYGVAAVRLDIGKEARIRTGQFFDIPGSLSQQQIISTVSWLLEKRRYHHGEVDIAKKTADNKPFRSPLLGLLLRGYLVDGKPRQDRLLLSRLDRDRCIPIPLIALCAVLIGHALEEWAAGYKAERDFSHEHLAGHYRAVMTSLTNLQERPPAYVKLLQTELYERMKTVGPEVVPAQTYDYEALDAFAQEPRSAYAETPEGSGSDKKMHCARDNNGDDNNGGDNNGGNNGGNNGDDNGEGRKPDDNGEGGKPDNGEGS